MKKTLKIILPVYNEEKSILLLKKELIKLENSIKEKFKITYIWVDDGSTDKSPQILKKIENKKNIVINFITNYGKTSAIQAGFDSLPTDYIAIIDTDLQDDPKYIKSILDKLINNEVDIVIGNRYNRYENDSLKKVSSHFIKNIIKILFPKLNIGDINCGLKVLTGQVSESIYLKSDYHRYIPLIAHIKGFKVLEMNIEQRKRKFGISKYGSTGFKRTWKSLSDLLSILFILKLATNPFSFFGKIGMFSCVAGFSILFYLTINWFAGEPINSRPLFFLGILGITTGVNFFSLGLIGDLVILNNKRNNYIVRYQRRND